MGKKNILDSPVGAEIGVIVRLFDKLSRIENLTGKAILEIQKESSGELKKVLKNIANNESLEDSWNDVIGYALIAIMLQRGEFENPLSPLDK